MNSAEQTTGSAGFAMLVGENGREFVIREGSSLEIDIGREKREDDLNYFNLSDANIMSKRHATIFWNKLENGFYIRNHSKNQVRYFQKKI